MSRRASSGVNVGQVAGIGIAILGFLLVAVLIFRLAMGNLLGSSSKPKARSSKNVAELDVRTYQENGRGLRGNLYRVDGKIEEILRWTPDRGRLISLEENSGAEHASLPVLVPKSFDNINLERGSDLRATVRVDRDGTLIAESIDP